MLFADRSVQPGHVPGRRRTGGTVLRRSLAVVVAGAALGAAAAPTAVNAATSTWGTVLISGQQWAGADAVLGDLNVYSNGTLNTDQPGPFGLKYECVELVQRWAHYKFGEPAIWPISKAADMWPVGPTLPVPLTQHPNGGASPPQHGDILVFAATSANPTGHAAIVSTVIGASVTSVQENLTVNGTPTGQWTQTLSGTTLPPLGGDPVLGWLRAVAAPYVPASSGPGGQILDSWGGLHPYGSGGGVSKGPYWSGWNIARDIAMEPGDPNSGYVLDGWGGVNAFGTATPVQVTAYFKGWDIARKLVLRADGHSGYVLDGWGGLHPFGVSGDIPPRVALSAYYPGWDIARGVALRSDGVSGYVMDGYGGFHPFGPSPAAVPMLSGSPYWKGWKIARDIVLSSNTGGYVLDGFGGFHPFGTAAAVSAPAYFPGFDVARGIHMSSSTGGFVVYQNGSLKPFGGAPTVKFSLMGIPLGQSVG